MKLVLVTDLDGCEIQINPKDIVEVREKKDVREIETKEYSILTKASAVIIKNSISNARYL